MNTERFIPTQMVLANPLYIVERAQILLPYVRVYDLFIAVGRLIGLPAAVSRCVSVSLHPDSFGVGRDQPLPEARRGFPV